MAGIVKRQHLLTGLATALHFLVDGLCLCCAYLLTEPFTLPHLAEIFITYNTIAFLTQPLTGHWADRIIHRNWMLIGAAASLSLAVLLTPLFIPAHSEVPLFGIAALLNVRLARRIPHRDRFGRLQQGERAIHQFQDADLAIIPRNGYEPGIAA